MNGTGTTTVVVGAGLSGLAAAMHLRGAGHRVTIVERESFPGGRNGTLEQDGFRFDTGPVVFTMVPLLEEAFAALGEHVEDHVTLDLLDPCYHGVFADGSTLDVRPGRELMREEIARECGTKDAAAFDTFVDWLQELNDVELPHFIDKNFSSPLSLFSSPSAALKLLRLRAFAKLGPEVNRRFDDERLHKLFSFQAMYAGLAPAKALALYSVITYMDSVQGVWFPRGGMHAVPKAMAGALESHGVHIRYSTSVDHILRDASGAARGVVLDDGEQLVADAVVVTADLPTAYERMLPGLRAPWVARHGEYSPSAVVWHLGVEGTEIPAGALHHNIHFGDQWDEAFDDLMVAGRPMRDPSRYVAIPSIHDPAAAPEGCQSLYVLEPVPNLKVGHVDWEREAPAMRERMLSFLQSAGYPTAIRTEQLVTPLDWQEQGMAAGTPFALSHTLRQSGPFRPRNIDRRVPGLAFAGSGTTPGVGIPMVLISGKLAAQRIIEGLR